MRGDPASRSFFLVYTRAGGVVALDCVNAVRDYVQGRDLGVAGVEVDPTRLADAGAPLKDLLGPPKTSFPPTQQMVS